VTTSRDISKTVLHIVDILKIETIPENMNEKCLEEGDVMGFKSRVHISKLFPRRGYHPDMNIDKTSRR
jgi:hypothetical protein